MKRFVQSTPYKWPYDGDLCPENTALIVIDMQVDFCGKGGYVDLMGYDLSLTRAPIEPIKSVMSACREFGAHVIHTREGHRTNLADLPANKKWRSEQIGAGIGSKGPCGRVLVRGEPGWDIIEELAPREGEVVIDKPGKGSFYATDLELVLRTAGIRNIILTGITTDVCVHTTMRDANDKGFECLLLTDCTGATDAGNHAAALKMVQMQGGVFGAVATSADVVTALKPPVLLLKELAAAPAQPAAAGPAAAVVKARPYDFKLPLGKTALIMIDFQKDFMVEGGFASQLGNDVATLTSCLPGAISLLRSARKAGLPVVHTMEAIKPDLSDLHVSKWSRGELQEGHRIGDRGPLGRILIRGAEGNGIIPEVAPIEGEYALHKPGKGAFYATDLDTHLRSQGVTHLLLAGVTTEVCVKSTIVEANDRGYDCLLVTDATASFFPKFKEVAIEMIVAQGGIFGWAADSDAVAEALEAAA